MKFLGGELVMLYGELPSQAKARKRFQLEPPTPHRRNSHTSRLEPDSVQSIKKCFAM